MAALVAIVMATGLWTGSIDQSQDPAQTLARARMAYNAQQFDEAIALATSVATRPDLAHGAALVRGRALLERFRRSGVPQDVALAGEVLDSIDVGRLSARERDEYRLALGERLFVDERYGAAAEVFEQALAALPEADAVSRARVLDWWAGALDRHAQLAPEGERQRRYGRLLAGLERERTVSVVVLYWKCAAHRGLEDLDRAWDLALAAWVQAPLVAAGANLVAFRADLDRLVREALIPERARRAATVADMETLRAALVADWEAVKK